jgi:hypothetical protein
MRAWRVSVVGQPLFTGIYAAPDRVTAQRHAHAQSREVGYHHPWIDFRVRRAPELDAWAAAQDTVRGLTAEAAIREAAQLERAA